jgi:signal transduction histidine kinase/HD-like signal output (HDOD) protein
VGSTRPSPPKQNPESPGESAGGSSHVSELEARLVDSVVRRTRIIRLPALPQVIDRALKAHREGTETKKTAEWLLLEPVLALRVLEAGAGMALPAGAQGATSMGERIAALGHEAVRALLLSSARASLTPRRVYLPAETLSGYWSHCVRVALIARALAEAAGYESREEAHLAGLLHDLGAPLLATAVPDTFRSLVDQKAWAETEGIPEQAGRLGTIHADIGARYLDGLDLPFHFRDAVLLHHAPGVELEGTHLLVRIVRSAESLVRQPASESRRGLAADLLGIPAASVQTALECAARAFEAVLRSLNLATVPSPRYEEEAFSRSFVDTRALTETLVGRVVEEARRSEARDRIPPQREEPVQAAGESQGPPPTASAAAISLLEQVLEDALQLELTVPLQTLDRIPQGLGTLMPLLAALVGIKRFLLFLPAAEGEAPWSGWKVEGGEVARFQLDLAPAVAHSLVARAGREGTTIVSYEAGGLKRLVGLDVQIARALEAEAIAALPLKEAGAPARGVLVLPVPALQAAEFEETMPLLEEVARKLAAAARRGKETGPAEALPLEALQASVRRLVHEARNPLSALKTYLEIARGRMRAGENVEKELEMVGHEIDRVALLLERMGRPEEEAAPEGGLTDINRMVEEFLLVYREPLFTRRGIRVDLDLDRGLPPVRTDARMLKQVLLNLLKNASEAVPEGGRLRITTSDLVNYEGQMMVEIALADTGPGIAPEKLATLFSLPAGAAPAGRGVGLANSLALVKTMGGHLACHSRVGAGTTVRILLPRITQG